MTAGLSRPRGRFGSLRKGGSVRYGKVARGDLLEVSEIRGDRGEGEALLESLRGLLARGGVDACRHPRSGRDVADGRQRGLELVGERRVVGGGGAEGDAEVVRADVDP